MCKLTDAIAAMSPRLTPSQGVECRPAEIIEVTLSDRMGRTMAINPRYIRFAKPAYRAAGDSPRTIISVEGLEDPVLANIDYEELSNLWKPFMTFNLKTSPNG